MGDERCKACSGTGLTPDPREALNRIEEIIDQRSFGMDVWIRSEDNLRWDDLTAIIRDYRRSVSGSVETAARKLIKLIDKIGNETEWKDREQTDRVFAWFEFDALRIALGDLESRFEGDEPDD